MALIKCKECGRDVSSQARVCPGCGAAVPNLKNFGKSLRELGCGLVSLAFLIALLVFAYAVAFS
jgi:hypothetical protein